MPTLVVDVDVDLDMDKARDMGWGRFLKGVPGNRACGPGAEKQTPIHPAGGVGDLASNQPRQQAPKLRVSLPRLDLLTRR